MISEDLKMKNRLKEARFFAKKPQIKLWLETGIHYSTISRIECGYIKPTEEQKERLASVLRVKVGWLFPEKNTKQWRGEKKGENKWVEKKN